MDTMYKLPLEDERAEEAGIVVKVTVFAQWLELEQYFFIYIVCENVFYKHFPPNFQHLCPEEDCCTVQGLKVTVKIQPYRVHRCRNVIR